MPSQREFYEILHEIADEAEPEVRRAIMSAINNLRSEVSLADLQAAVATGNVEAIIATIGAPTLLAASLAPVAHRLINVYNDSAFATLEILPKQARMNVRFDVTNPNATFYARDLSSTLVTQVNNETRQGIREIVAIAFEEGGHPYAQAIKIRSLIGLNKRQAIAYDNYKGMLQQTKFSQATIEKRLKNYYNKQINYRARMIARTETIDASNAGQQALWIEAENQGYLDAADVRRKWIVTPDDKLCERCKAVPRLNPGGVGLHEPFTTTLGPRMYPTLHPQCRCAIGLTRAKPL